MWEKSVVAYFQVPSQHLHGETEKITEASLIRCPCRDSDRAPPDYKPEELPSETACSMENEIIPF
jgi:hypothetical protein